MTIIWIILIIVFSALLIRFIYKINKSDRKKHTTIDHPMGHEPNISSELSDEEIDNLKVKIKKPGGKMKQQFVKKEVGTFAFTNRGLENKVLTALNELVTEANASGGKVERYEILNNERWGKNISIIALITWD